jgi:RNA-directed DNA polymerase
MGRDELLNYSEYSNKFSKEAESKGYSAEYIKKCLDYAEALFHKDIPVIFDPNHLCMLLGIKPAYVFMVSNSPRHFYRKFNIKKKGGGVRRISEPLPLLKEIQKWILTEILYKIDCSKYSKAFKPDTSIKDNAKFHRKQKVVINMDIENYFKTIKISSVYDFFISLGYKNNIAVLLTKLCTLNGSLPQGAPTSPYLSNLTTILLDNKLFSLANSYNPKLRYSRYADDITFSGDCEPNKLIKSASKIIYKEKFKVNRKKTRVIYSNKRQEVTGIVVNSKLQVKKDTRKNVRQSMYFIKKFGLSEHLRMIEWNGTKQRYIEYMLGLVNFILFVNPNDKESKLYKVELLELIKRKDLINSQEIDIFNKGFIYDDI